NDPPRGTGRVLARWCCSPRWCIGSRVGEAVRCTCAGTSVFTGPSTLCERMEAGVDQVSELVLGHSQRYRVTLDSGDTYASAAMLCDLGIISLLRGELEQAADQLREAVMLARQMGDVLVTAICLDALAATAGANGRPRDVAMLLGA